jgi:HEAT repeat protein
MRLLFTTAILSAVFLAASSGQTPLGKGEKEPVSSENLEIAGKTLQEWIAEIGSPDRSKGENAIRTSLMFGPDRAYEALPAIMKVLGTHTASYPLDVSVRVNGVIAVGIIIGSAQDPDPKHVQDAVLLLTRFLSDREAIVRYRAAEALGRIGPDARAAIPKLLDLIDDPTTWETRLAVSVALGTIAVDEKNKTAPPVEVLSALFKRLSDSASRVRLAAIQSLTYLGAPANPMHKTNLIKALGQVAQQDSDPTVRIWAIMAIMGCHEITDPLVGEVAKMLKNKDMSARLQAAQALATIGPKAKTAVPALVGALDDREDVVVLYSIMALGRMELWGGPALPALQKISSDAERPDLLQQAANQAIAAIKGIPIEKKK